MFWGVTLDSQKRYSKVTDRPYHISMAKLQPNLEGMESSKEYVSLKLEHKNSEYFLCSLQYGKVMQVALDLMFSKGEHTCFSLLGKGTVHLTGYYLDDDEESNEDTTMALSSDYSKQDLQLVSLKSEGGDDEDDDEDDDDWSPDPKANERSLDGDVSDSEESGSVVNSDSGMNSEDDIKDVTPTMVLQKNGKGQVNNTKKNKDSSEESKRKNELQKGSKAKKLRAESSTPGEISPKKSRKLTSDVSPVQTEVQAKKEMLINNTKEVSDDDDDEEEDDDEDDEDDDDDEESDEEEVSLNKQNDGNTVNDEEEEEEEDDSDDSMNDEKNSSIGRTPMPKSKVKKPAQLSMSIEVASKKSSTKAETKSKDIVEASKKNNLSIPALTPINSKNVNSSTPKNAPATKRNVSGVEIEDLRVGSGPPAKAGRFVSIHYVGKLTNGKKFDSNEAPKKPFSFRLGKGEVIKGFDIGVLGMKVGGKRKITIPPNLAYGKQKQADIPANSTLVFVIDLVAVN